MYKSKESFISKEEARDTFDKEHKDIQPRALSGIEKIKEQFEIFKEESKEDCKKLDKTKITQETDNIVSIKNKWIRYRFDFTFKLTELRVTKESVERDLIEFYKGNNLGYKIETKDELNLHIRTDNTYQDFLTMYNLVESIIDFCDACILSIKDKQYAIRNHIDWERFSNGQI